MYEPLPTAPSSPIPPGGPGKAYSPIDTMQAAFQHIFAHLRGHGQVMAAWFVMFISLMVVNIMLTVGFIVGMETRAIDPGTGIALLYGGIFGITVLLVPIVSIFWYGYQKALLIEVDGGDPVSLARIGHLGWGSIATVLGVFAAGCGLSFVGLLCCYVGVFFVAIPFRFVFLIAVDQEVGVMEAYGRAWTLFRSRMKDHVLALLVVFVVSMIGSAIPLIGGAITFPLLEAFDVLTYRTFVPKRT